mmetsp:Transcript_56634/g.47775  ORF Transcript_56634/g.47775 Transcript_56634/m.47775 type:complete len:156 (+) Transcript_56634:379-846(+)
MPPSPISRSCCCSCHIEAYRPFSFDSSSTCDPISAMPPSCKTAILLALMMVDSLCAMMSVVLPWHTFSRASCMRCSVWVSRALVASSSKTNFGFLRIVRAMATRCFSPPDKRRPRSPTLVSHLSGKFIMVSYTEAALAASIISSSVASGLLYMRL